MLSRLYATNYRCLVNFEFRPTSKQLLIGRNGTGKTTVLDVLALLRDFAGRGLPCEDQLGGKTRTRWQDVPNQRFELDVKSNGGEYHYELVVGEYGSPLRPVIEHESLDFDGKRLFRSASGVIELFGDERQPAPKIQFPSDPHRSGLTIIGDSWKRTELTWFKRWLGGLVEVQINPWAMSARSEVESRYPRKDLSNFADWYRHLLLESGRAVFEAMTSLRDAIPGLEGLDAKEAGLDVRVLQATMRSPNGQTVDLPFSDLSEGQKTLIALYVLLFCAVGGEGMLLIDEPDNFVALAEIQPWLMRFLDRVDEQDAQVIIVSHHPELLDQLADQGGVVLDRPGGGETVVRGFEPSKNGGLKASEIIARGWEQHSDSLDGLLPSTIKELPKRRKHVVPGATRRKRG